MGWGIMDLIVILAIVAVLVLPVKIAANIVGARNTGVFTCLFALIFAAIIQKAVTFVMPFFAMQYPLLDSVVALLLSAFSYMLILGTTYLKGIAIALMQILLSLALLFAIGLLGLGVSNEIIHTKYWF